ncbi:MAG: VCBS repeat-containing protein, partial [Planctomycetota bacterium]
VDGQSSYPIQVYGPESGYARHDMADWNNDGFMDLVVGDEEARAFIFLNDGLGNDPPTFQPGSQLWANGKPLDCLKRGSPLVCDWNNDGKKDLIFGMTPKQTDYNTPYDWPYQDGDNDKTDDEGFLFYRNIGSDADPVLAYPSWIRAGGQIITYTRPNLGSFVDWNGDGVKDFISCLFESDVRFYENIGSGAPNAEPLLSPAQGNILVEPFCKTQMLSGADVLDWREDGDLDILTGQGHSGSGLRFYERDYVNDFVNNTYPTVTITTPNSVPPADVNPLRAYRQSGTRVLLTWVNPDDSDLDGVMIRYRTDTYPTSITDGTELCNRVASPGSSDTFTHDVSSGQVVYYTAFAYDIWLNYAGGTQAVTSGYWLNETFDSYSVGDLDGQGGWTRSPGRYSCQVQDSVYSGGTGNAVEMFGTTGVYDDDSLSNFGTITGGYQKVSFDMRRNTGATQDQGVVNIYGSGSIPVKVYWSSGYKILTGPGTTFTDLVTSPLSDRWYHVDIGINLNERTLNAWVDGDQKVFGQPFYQDTDRIDTVNLVGFGYSGTTTPSYIDNLMGATLVYTIPPDFDGDLDVDLDDFDIFMSCVSGSGAQYDPDNLPQGCFLIPDGGGIISADFDKDSDVDQSDFGTFQCCLSGDGKLADPNCAD